MNISLAVAWPSSLPLPSVDYQMVPRNATIFGQDEHLRVERRSRFKKSYSQLSVSWTFTRAQFEAFKSFFKNDLHNGASQFRIELRYPKNTALTAWAVRIEQGFECTHTDGYWMVNGGMELVNPVVI